MREKRYKGILWLNICHTFMGHPKKDCHKIGELSVKCKCGEIISLSDFY